MTLEELQELFPIFLTEHKVCWSTWYAEEKKEFQPFFRTRHSVSIIIGSTAINGIWARPIIDILLEIPDTISMASVKQTL